ncbi:UNVERIFIED_CONTAM: hypothetical protein Slati_2086400 [Sesamum latifolium]|uniref:Uncharacterized protein n=1 Tax=Sesamum latifolium TaxID=2727402 RepID=A0AAW2WPB2_9LAMI
MDRVQTCVRQFDSEGFAPAGTNLSFLNEETGLEDAPESEEGTTLAEETPSLAEEQDHMQVDASGVFIERVPEALDVLPLKISPPTAVWEEYLPLSGGGRH